MVKQLKLNIQTDEKIVNKKIKEEFTLKNATIYGGYNIFLAIIFPAMGSMVFLNRSLRG